MNWSTDRRPQDELQLQLQKVLDTIGSIIFEPSAFKPLTNFYADCAPAALGFVNILIHFNKISSF
jgi:hypothetical protein